MTTAPTCEKDLATGTGRQCCLCGSLLDTQLEHGETCITGGHYACVHAVLGGLTLANPSITTEHRGLTEAQSRLADLFTTERGLDVCVLHPSMQQQPEEMLHKQPLIVPPYITDIKCPIFEVRDHLPLPVLTADSKCQTKPSSTDGNTKSKLPSSDEEQP